MAKQRGNAAKSKSGGKSKSAKGSTEPRCAKRLRKPIESR